MTRPIAKLLLLLLTLAASTAQCQDKALLDSLDRAIAQTPQTVARKERHIARLRRQLAAQHTAHGRYAACWRLYEAFRPYRNDSALHYLGQCAAIARRHGDTPREGDALAMTALQCSSAGNYAEASSLLAAVDTARLDRRGRADYAWAARHLYGELAFYTKVEHLRAIYAARAKSYEAAALRLLSPTDDRRLQLQEVAARSAGRYAEALRLNDRRMSQVKRGSHAYSIVCFYRAQTYRASGDRPRYLHYIALSALCDARLAVMDQGAMWELASNLADGDGGRQRSYRYIKYAWQAAETFGTALRSRQIMPVLSATEESYQRGLSQSNLLLKVATAVAVVLLVLVLGLLVFAMKQNKRLSLAHRRLAAANDSLQQANASLQQAYAHLNEMGRMKEVYIGRFLRLCAIYADKIESLRKKVARLVKNREYSKLATLLQDDNHSIDELYEHFDSAFLNLFPTFVSEFNALLRPEERITPPDATRLTTQIRIFALIRLGIEDSSKIAEFLHYSANTIYNYRAMVKNGALGNRDEFEKKVKEIGK